MWVGELAEELFPSSKSQSQVAMDPGAGMEDWLMNGAIIPQEGGRAKLVTGLGVINTGLVTVSVHPPCPVTTRVMLYWPWVAYRCAGFC